MKYAILAVSLLTASCISPAEQRLRDQTACVDYGFELGSQAMASCLQTRDENRLTRTQAAILDAGNSLQSQGQSMILNSNLMMLRRW